MKMTSIGQWNNEIAKKIYQMNRTRVNSSVKSGSIKPENANVEFAKGVARDLKNAGGTVPKTILKMLGK
jgi:hypothetical protein